MIIEIHNTSSPGASFTENTNSVLLKTYDWIVEHPGEVLTFKEFRMNLQEDKGINDNNNRNIYPLLKNGKLVEYEKQSDLYVDSFFTRRGLAYVKSLQSKKMLSSEKYTKEQIIQAEKKFDEILADIIYDSLLIITKENIANYVEPLQDMVRYLLKYKKINKVEFAYLIYMKGKYNTTESLENMQSDIILYRDGELEFEINVQVRNDIELRKKTNRHNRKEGLGFLTSYGYLIGLLQQAGLVNKVDGYYFVVEDKLEKLSKLGGAIDE